MIDCNTVLKETVESCDGAISLSGETNSGGVVAAGVEGGDDVPLSVLGDDGAG